jgi:sulfoxide reductase catalytic subunit YedY
MKPYALEERIYRMRCVEAWSVVVPWVGIPMAEVIKRVEPDVESGRSWSSPRCRTRAASPMQRTDLLEWPYIEGLRLDEAQHPLTLLAVGLYGEVLPAQNGAPDSPRRAVEVRVQGRQVACPHPLRDKQPLNTWQKMRGTNTGSTPT